MPTPKAKRQPAWRRTPDAVILATTKPLGQLPRAESLNPNHRTVEAAACGDDSYARAIIDAWAFRAPVVRQ